MDINKEINNLINSLRSGAVLEDYKYLEYHRLLSGEFAYCMNEFTALEISKYKKIKEIRAQVKSDKMAETEWKASEDGEKYIRLRNKLEILTKLLTSMKSNADKTRQEFNHQRHY